MDGGREASASLIHSGTQADEDSTTWNVNSCCNKGKEKLENHAGALKTSFHHFISQNISHIARLFQGGWECSLLCVRHSHAIEHEYSGDHHRQDCQQRCEGKAPA